MIEPGWPDAAPPARPRAAAAGTLDRRPHGARLVRRVKIAALVLSAALLVGARGAWAEGFTDPVDVPIPEGIEVAVERNVISVAGCDKQTVGQFAARVRAVKRPEPYNGKGIKYTDEVILRKQGKVFGT